MTVLTIYNKARDVIFGVTPYSRPAEPYMWRGQLRQNWSACGQHEVKYTQLRLCIILPVYFCIHHVQ